MFARLAERIARWSGQPAGLGTAVGLSLAGWLLLGVERTVLLVSFVTWWQLFLLQHAQNRDTAEIKAAVRELVRAVPDADAAAVAAAVDPER